MDSNYNFYLHIENLKNSLYRQLSSARQSSLFWPKFYYSWFYADEKTLFNILNLRQKLGLEITDNEITTYNHMRKNMLPPSSYTLKQMQVKAKVDGSSVEYSDIAWRRTSQKKLMLTSLAVGVVAHQVLKMTRWWYFVAFAPALLLTYMDHKFAPYGELENFYKYVYERRRAEAQYKTNEDEIQGELMKADADNYLQLRDELLRNNTTLYEVTQDLDELYLTAAIRSESRQ